MKKLLIVVLCIIVNSVFADSFKIVEDGIIILDGYAHLVDRDLDNIPNMESYELHIEDDGRIKADSEGIVDQCPNIPNISLSDKHCSIDLDGDGYFTLKDFLYLPYDHYYLAAPTITFPNYKTLGVPDNFGGFGCFYHLRLLEYNRRLKEKGLPALESVQPDGEMNFKVYQAPRHCTLPAGHHSYPIIQ